MRLSASSSGLTSVGCRLDRKPSAPSWRKQGAASLLSPRVSWVGAEPSVGTFHRSETYLTPSRSSRCTATASHVPSGEGAIEDNALQRDVLLNGVGSGRHRQCVVRSVQRSGRSVGRGKGRALWRKARRRAPAPVGAARIRKCGNRGPLQRPGPQRPVTDVAPELHAVELDLLDGVIGALLRRPDRVAERRHAQDAAAAGDEPLAAERRAAWNVTQSSRSSGSRVIASPLRGASG